MRPMIARTGRRFFYIDAVFLGAAMFWMSQGAAVAQVPAHSLISQGEERLAMGDLDEARSIFQQALDQSGNEVAAYTGIARVSLKQRRWEQALREIERAVEAGGASDLAVRYYKGVILREIAKFDVLRAPMHREQAESLFQGIIDEDSTYGAVFFELGLIRRYTEDYPEAIRLGHRQLAIHPDEARVHVGLHRMYRHYLEFGEQEEVKAFLGDQPEAYRTFFTAEMDRKAGRVNFAAGRLEQLLEAGDPMLPVQPVLLARARLFYADRKPSQGQELVDRAIETISSEAEAAFVFEDFKFVLTDAELKQYRHLTTIEEKKAFLSSMWVARDPMPARPENARLTEHYRRMLVAEKEYLYYGIRSWHNNPDRAGHLSFPAVTYLNEEFNDKGLIFIRHGEPLDRVTHVGGADNFFRTQIFGIESANWMPSERSYNTGYALNESWRYRDPDVDFHFVVASNEENNWRLIPFLTSFEMLESREHWGNPYAAMVRALRSQTQMGQGAENFAFNAELEDGSQEFADTSGTVGITGVSSVSNVRGQAMRFDLELEEARQMMIQESQEAIEIGLATDRHVWEAETEPMPIPYMLVSFRGPDGLTELDLYYALPIGKISKIWEGAGSKIPVESGFAVMDSSWRMVDEAAVTRDLPRSEDETAAVIDFYRSTVPPDSYVVALHGVPRDIPLLGGYKFGYRVPDYSGSELAMSDLLLAHDIQLTIAGQSRYERNGYKIQSNPFQRFSRSQIVYIYFELYNLTYDTDDMTRYDIEYILTPADRKEGGLFKRRRTRPILSLKVERSGELRSPVEYAEFDVQEVDPGQYDMLIRITDKVTGAVVEKDRRFELTP